MSTFALIIGIACVWLSGYSLGQTRRRSGYQPAPGDLGIPPRTGSAVYRGNIPPVPPARDPSAPYPARPSR
jgi:hypothetical protein